MKYNLLKYKSYRDYKKSNSAKGYSLVASNRINKRNIFT